MCFALCDVDDEKRRVEKGGGAVAGALSASLAPDLPDPDMPHYFYTTYKDVHWNNRVSD